MLTREELIGTGECRDRDEELVRLIGRHGLMTIEQAQRAMGTGRSVTYRRVRHLADAGLVERVTVPGAGSLLHATRQGLRWSGLALAVATVSAAEVEHGLRCVTTAIRAGEHYGHENVLTERELIGIEALGEQHFASVSLGLSRGQRRWHRPDLVVLQEEGPIAIEVELTPKAPARLERIMRAWRRAVGGGEFSGVHYRCAPGASRRAVERAVAKVRAEGVIGVGEVPS
jgi:DNA-binding Lrp family transcriptional regulator